MRGGEGAVDRDAVASNCSTGKRLSSFHKRINLNNSIRVFNRIIPPSEYRMSVPKSSTRLVYFVTFGEGSLSEVGMPTYTYIYIYREREM